MRYHPSFSQFQQLAPGHTFVPVYRQLVSDTLTPVSAYCRLHKTAESFLFESVIGGERVGRFSFVGTGPFLKLTAHGTHVCLTEGEQTREFELADPLIMLQELLDRHRAVTLPGLPRFCGGAVGYAGYDTVRYTEHLPNPPTDDRKLPDLSFAFYDQMIIFDHIRKTVLVVVLAAVIQDEHALPLHLDRAYQTACRRVDEVCQQLQSGADTLALCDLSIDGTPEIAFEPSVSRSVYESAVMKCQEYIRAGDIFQVVLSQRLKLQTQATPLDIYRALRVVNPSPFMFLLNSEAVSLVGSSPEIMVRTEEGTVTIRPLAGTRRRGQTEAEDQALEHELLADEKERAEHVMLVDLARNDVGRVAEYGSVQISDMMKVERYSHVMHITSNVTGRLTPGRTALDALRAGLPAGTVSGAPKVRAMEIIDELETCRRGPYAGAVGYIDFTGNMDTCIALRTLVMQGQTAYIQAGAGIVADSIPALEYEETLSKARGLLKAIEVAERDLSAQGN